MDFLHCNACGHHPQFGDQRNYLMTSCGHVFCQACSSRISDTCPACRAKCRLAQISSDAKSEIKAYFMDPTELFKENMKQLIQVMQFQKTQLKSFTHQFGKLVERHKSLKNDADSLKEENAELKKRLEALQCREQSWIGNGIIRTSPAPRAPENRFLQQPIDPAFNAIFGHQNSANLDICSTPPNRIQVPTQNQSHQRTSSATSIGRIGGGRITLPVTPSYGQQRENRYSPSVSITNTVGTTLYTPRSVGSSGYQSTGQQNHSTVATPDIVARLKKLRW